MPSYNFLLIYLIIYTNCWIWDLSLLFFPTHPNVRMPSSFCSFSTCMGRGGVIISINIENSRSVPIDKQWPPGMFGHFQVRFSPLKKRRFKKQRS